VDQWHDEFMRAATSTSTSTSETISLRRTPRSTLSKVVAEQLMEAIEDLEPGARVPSERDLTRMLGVSRTTLREALHGLVTLGIIEVRHGQGAYVSAGGPALAEADNLGAVLAKGITSDLVETLRVVMIEVARLAAERRTGQDLSELATAVDLHRNALREGRNPAEEGTLFDNLLAQAAHNEVLAGVLRSLSRLIWARARRVLDGSPEFQQPDLRDHEAILAAVAARDTNAAVELMARHHDAVVRAYRLTGQA
jgi:GntR family transcriptional regulator, transcriptional repressor for pyruvate dehydrogenase complex